LVTLVFMYMANPTPSKSPKHDFSKPIIKIAVTVSIAVVILAVVILAIPKLQEQMSSKPTPQFTITSKVNWWTRDESLDGIGGEQVLHVKVAVKNYGEVAGVCQLNVKVEESGGRSWIRFRIISVSPGDTIEEQFDFPEVVDENVEYSAWLTEQ